MPINNIEEVEINDSSVDEEITKPAVVAKEFCVQLDEDESDHESDSGEIDAFTNVFSCGNTHSNVVGTLF